MAEPKKITTSKLASAVQELLAVRFSTEAEKMKTEINKLAQQVQQRMRQIEVALDQVCSQAATTAMKGKWWDQTNTQSPIRSGGDGTKFQIHATALVDVPKSAEPLMKEYADLYQQQQELNQESNRLYYATNGRSRTDFRDFGRKLVELLGQDAQASALLQQLKPHVEAALQKLK